MKNLKKILSVLALIVLVWSDFLTSISYALEDGLEDSVVVQTESEEEMENVENEEGNVDEEDSEDAYEDESIEEEELETENLTLDIVESTTWGIVEEWTWEVSEIGSWEVEELTEETVEWVTWDIAEELTWDVEELTGTVDENTETGEDIVFEDITYNEAPIIWEKTYNDVTVRVEALTWIFPEWTDLTIEPIKWWDLSVLKDKLVDEQEEVKEDTTVVAFDITFRYEWEEVQPKEWEKVKVTFDYSKNENLLEADKNENQEVKVYHIEDMDNNWKKINQWEEVVKDVTNKVESEEEWIAVVDAESFSIYAVVTTTWNPDSVTVTHYLNGWYWMEDHSTESKPIVYTCINNSCTTTTHYKTPSKDGYMFMGWIDGSWNRRKDGVATDGMSVYAKWQEFWDLNVYILWSDNDSDKHQYTLMDRNMWALDIYNKSWTINDESRWYYYQWWNNYGFDSHYENSGALSETTKQKVDVANYSWEFPYYGYKFYLNWAKEYANWMSWSVNKSLWWDGNITSKEAKQWPCPAWYYIPSKNDWQWLLVSWNSVNSRAEKNFYFDFLVPSAWIRDRWYQQGNGSKVVDIERYRYASSSRNNNDTKTKAVITLTQTEMDKVPIVSPSSNNNDRSHERWSNGLSVRCFKNVTGSIINISDIDLNWWQKAIISIDSWEVVSLQNPVRNSDEFRWWYTTSNFSWNPIWVWSWLSVWDKLYARRCADWLVDDGTQCIDGYSITFDSNGWSPVATQTVSPLGTGTRPTDPTKMWYVFTGWFLTWAIEEFDFTWTQITGNITLYAHWNTWESYFKINCNKKKLDVDNNQLLDKSDPYLTWIVITWATDSEIILANYSNRCNLAWYEYTWAMVYGSDDGSWSKLSTTTLLADGTRVIEMYFQPVKNQFTLNSADYTSTVWSSQNGLYYYWAKVTLSGDSSDDCFEWDEWNWLPEWTTNSAQTSFSMPNDSVTVTPSVKENTYNIIFSGNGSSSWEMSSINEVKCTESIQLTPNAFGKTWYTFTGWSRTSWENIREYIDWQTVSGLSKTNLDDVTLYAVWDINKYIVTGSVAAWQENMWYLSGNTSTWVSLTWLYEYGKELVFIAVPEIGYLFDYWKNWDTILSGTDLWDGTNQLTVIVDQILDIIAFFKPAENTPYTVEHYKQNLTQDWYEFAWSGTMYWTTNESTNATGTDYEWFTLSGDLASYQTWIKADWSTIVRLYYDRDTYTVTWNVWSWHYSFEKSDVAYWSQPVFKRDGEDPYTPSRWMEIGEEEYDFTFTWWTKNWGTEIVDMSREIVTWNVTYTAQYSSWYRYYTINYKPNEWVWTMESQRLQLHSSWTLNKNEFTKTGYVFSGWRYKYADDIEVFLEDEQEVNLSRDNGVMIWEWEEPYLDLEAQWKPSTDTKVTVNYYLKDLDKENNVLIDSRTEYAIWVEFIWTTDSIIESILSRYGTWINGYEYSTSIVYGTDYPDWVETWTTTVLADGSRVIDMYYVPKKYNFILNTVQYSSTAWSSQNRLYYYWAKVILSGDSSDDCFTWSGWMTSWITLSDNMSHQTWFAMPANDVEATPSTTENMYNIIFNGNGSNSWIMPPMNGVRCTESTWLTLNSFERDWYTFTGWSTTAWWSRKYADGAIVDRLSTWVDVNLYAVWNVNHYTVTFDLNGWNLTWDMTETKDYTIETSSISLIDYEPERNWYTFTGWYRNDVLVNSIAWWETWDYTLVARWEAQRRPVPVVVYKKMLIPGEWSEYESELMWWWWTVWELYTAPLENFTPTWFHYEEENDSNRRTVVVDPDLRNEVAIFFARNLYPVIIDNAGEWRSSDTSWSSDYLYEEPVTISVTPYTWWEFINWTLIQWTLSWITDWTQRTLSFNMPAEQVMISPILDHIPYTVSFDTASWTTVENQTYYYDDVLSGLNSAITTRTWYNFDGWYLSGALYTSGSTMPAENITLTAKWAPCTWIQYQVNHRWENTWDNNYEVLLSGYIMYGTSDTQTIAKSEEFAGFTLSGNVEQKAINPNGTTEVNIYYNRNVYTISLDNNGWTGVSEITWKYQSAIAKPDDPNRLGYNFAWWDPSIPDTMPLNGGESTAKWNPGLTQYTVNYHIEKVQTWEYDIYTGVYAWETDSSPWIPLLNPSLTGFITPAQFTGKIIPWWTEFDYYYDRDSYMLYYDTAWWTPIPWKSFRYGEKILTWETQRPWYTLIKWNNIPEDGNMPAQSGLTLVALREPDAHTKYTVYHYFESLSWWYVTGNVQPLSGTTDTLTTARPISVPWYKTDFDIGDEEHTGGQVNIDGDGNAHVEIYYDRIVYQIAFDMNGWDAIQWTGVKFWTYIKSFIDSLNPHKKWYAFSGWNPEFPTAMPDRNLTWIAMWTPATGEYKVEFYYQRADGTYSSTATREELRTWKTEWVWRVKDSDKEPSIAGYAFDSTNTGNVLEWQIVWDGSLVLKLYFKKQFTVRYLTWSHGTFSEDVHPNLDYGVWMPVFRWSTWSHDSWYTFLWWDPELTWVVVEDRDYIAQWKADSDTEFKVEYYLQNVEDDGYTFAETGLQTGTTNTTGYADIMKEFTWFIFSGWNQNNVTSGLIAWDGSLVLKLYYDRKEYNVTTWEVEHGTMEWGAGSQRYGKRIIFTAHPDAWYLISKWLRGGNEILSGWVIWTGEELEVEVDTWMEISVEFKAKEDTPYYVEYYKENLEWGYEVWTWTYSGTTDQEAVAQELSFTWFTYDSWDERNERTWNIDWDGSRVLRLYYTRNTNNVVYVYTWKVPSGQVVPETTGYKYEATVIVAEAPNVLWYNFSWSTWVSSFTMPDENVVITWIWVANTWTKYAVQHMLQNIEDDGYTQTWENQILSWETDELTNAQANNYTWFIAQSFSQTWIKWDGSLVLKLYYDRNEYEVITWEVEHGTMEWGTGSQKYGKRITFTAHPDAWYVISKWLRDGNEILSGWVIWTGEELEIKVDTWMEISVEFKAKEDTPYYVEYYKEKLGWGYDVWTWTYSGTTDQEAVAQELSFTWFTFSGWNQSNITSGVIAWDGSLVLKLFYDRNKYTITWKDGNDEVLKTDQLFYGALPEYTGEMPTKTATAQYSYTFNNTWTPAIEIVTTWVTYTAQFDVEVNKYLITFVDGDGKIVQSWMVVYGEMPQYTWTTPTKTATAQYSYTFNNTWAPAIELVTTWVTYTAQFDSTVNEYTISIVPSDTDMWTVSPSEINVSYGSTIVESGNIITVWWVEVKATPKSADVQYTYEFDSWTNTCGSELIWTCTIQANFRKILNKYSITWMNDDWSLIDTTMVGYGVIPTHAKPTKTETEEYRYVFVWWDPEVVAVVWDAEYTAVFNAEEKEQTSKWGNMSGWGWRRSGIDNAENSDNQHGSAEENSNLFTWDYYVSSWNVDEETLSLYEWAHENDITTMDTLEYANPDWLLTRWHMAKMVVNFAQNVLWKTIPTEYPDKCNWKDKESERESSEIKEYAKKACALWLMWIYVEEFMPNKVLDRAEFGTIISRLLWWDKYNVIDTDHRWYYEDHLWALKKHGILTQTDNPEERRELRKWVWLVFRRISEKLKK